MIGLFAATEFDADGSLTIRCSFVHLFTPLTLCIFKLYMEQTLKAVLDLKEV